MKVQVQHTERPERSTATIEFGEREHYVIVQEINGRLHIMALSPGMGALRVYPISGNVVELEIEDRSK